MAICEAMALGTPVIGAHVGGIPRMIRDQATGLLFQSGNASELADKIQYLLENESARRQLGEAARKYAVETHHPDRVAQLTRAAYQQILDGKR
jgi:glycosyltransferase involved in cell wall biosynthesis